MTDLFLYHIQSSHACLTWPRLTGHGVLLNVGRDRVCIIRCLMDPPVRPLPKQNPEAENRNMLSVILKKNLPPTLISPTQLHSKSFTHHLNTKFSQSPITATQMSLMPTDGRR